MFFIGVLCFQTFQNIGLLTIVSCHGLSIFSSVKCTTQGRIQPFRLSSSSFLFSSDTWRKNLNLKQPCGGSLKTFVIALILIFQVASQSLQCSSSQMSIKNLETSVKKKAAGFWIAT